MFISTGKWWNSNEIKLIQKDNKIYALAGWDGEKYCDCWQCVGEYNIDVKGNFTITPIYMQLGEDEFKIIDYNIVEGRA